MDIKVLNNAFELDYQQYLYNQCRNASYKIGWNDTGLVDTSNRVYQNTKSFAVENYKNRVPQKTNSIYYTKRLKIIFYRSFAFGRRLGTINEVS